MSPSTRRTRYATVTAGVRLFALIALVVPVIVAADYAVVVCAILLAAVWMAGIFADGVRHLSPMVALVVEASLVTFVACLSMETSRGLLLALAVTPFVAGMVRGVRGTLEVLGAQVIVCLATIVPHPRVTMTPTLIADLAVWVMLGLGLGLIAALLQHMHGDERLVTSYRDARALLVELRDLSDSLVEGLDPIGISSRVLDLANSQLPLAGAVVYAPSSNAFTPLVEGDVSAHAFDNRHVLEACLHGALPVVDGPWAAFPLVTDAGVVAVVAGGILPDARSTTQLRDDLATTAELLRPQALQLDTALIFAAVRGEATAGERRRLARELHDGVAQDLASLGYLIDDLAGTSITEDQQIRCAELRSELGRVVTELRHSLFVLRNESRDVPSLGAGVSALAAHLESRTGIRVQVEVNEGPHRLRSDVESELLRIAQEAMTNAVKHSAARAVDVSVEVMAPAAVISVVDDGHGLGARRDDSHGIRIMHERAERIGASLTLRNREDRSGAQLRVVLDPGRRSARTGQILEGSAP